MAEYDEVYADMVSALETINDSLDNVETDIDSLSTNIERQIENDVVAELNPKQEKALLVSVLKASGAIPRLEAELESPTPIKTGAIISFLSHPQNTSGYSGTSVTFSVATSIDTDGLPLSYQWYQKRKGASDWKFIKNANTPNYTFQALYDIHHEALYKVVVSSPNTNSVTSNEASLTILRGNIIITQNLPSVVTVVNDTTHTFEVVASTQSGTIQLSYQWYSRIAEGRWEEIEGATTDSYTLAVTESLNDTYYRVLVSGTDIQAVYSNECRLLAVDPIIAITQHPSDLTIKTGETATFSVQAVIENISGEQPEIIYWWQNASSASGPWTTLEDESPATRYDNLYSYTAYRKDTNTYYRVLCNYEGVEQLASNVARLIVNPPIITIASQPVNTNVYASQTATFSITATIDPSYSILEYQWQKKTTGDFIDISGANEATLSISTVTTDHNSQYRVIVFCKEFETIVATTTSTSVTLGVLTPSISVTPLQANYEFLHGTQATLSVTATPNPSGIPLTYSWYKSNTGTAPWTEITPQVNNKDYVFTADILNDLMYYRPKIAYKEGSSEIVTAYPVNITQLSVTPKVSITMSDVEVMTGSNATFTPSITQNPGGLSLTYAWYRGATPETATTLISGANSSTYTLTGANYLNDNVYIKVRVNIMNGGSVLRYYEKTVRLTVTVVIISINAAYPQNSTDKYASQTATFTVAGQVTLNPSNWSGTLAYQWYKKPIATSTWSDSHAISGATSNSYTTAALLTTDTAYHYRVKITAIDNGTPINSTYSRDATLTVLTPTLSINSSYPTDSNSAYVTQTANFTVASQITTVPANWADIRYQWYRKLSSVTSWTTISGANTSSFTTPALLTSDTSYHYKVNAMLYQGASSIANSDSRTALLTVLNPVVTLDSSLPANLPVSGSFYAGATASFSISVLSKTPTNLTVTYQWEKRIGTTNPWNAISGATSTTYSFSTTMNDNNTYYQCKVNYSENSVVKYTVTSRIASLVITTPIINITSQPTGLTKYISESATFSVVASTTPVGGTLTYQWQKGFGTSAAAATYSNISGATSATYSISSVDADHYGTASPRGSYYRCVVSGTISGVTLTPVTSSSAFLAVSFPVVSGGNLSNVTATYRGTASWTYSPTITPSSATSYATYQWQEYLNSTWTNLSGKTSNVLSYSSVVWATQQGDNYRCNLVFKDASIEMSSAQSNTAVLTIMAPTYSITGNLANDSNYYGLELAPSSKTFTFAVTVNNLSGTLDTKTHTWYLTTSEYSSTFTSRESIRGWIQVASNSNGTKLLACSDGENATGGYLYTSINSGVNWTQRSMNKRWSGVAMSADGVRMVASEIPGYLYTSSDSGANWTSRMTDATRAWFHVASSASGKILLASATGEYVYVSYDYGVTWTAKISTIRQWKNVAMSYDGRYMAVAAEYYGLLVSNDYGNTWSTFTVPGVIYWYSVAVNETGQTMYAGVAPGKIYKSYDYGVTWTALETSPNKNWVSLSTDAEGTRVVGAAFGDYLYISENSGGTWYSKVNLGSKIWRGTACSTEGKIIAAANGNYLYTSEQSWFGPFAIANTTNNSYALSYITYPRDAKISSRLTVTAIDGGTSNVVLTLNSAESLITRHKFGILENLPVTVYPGDVLSFSLFNHQQGTFTFEIPNWYYTPPGGFEYYLTQSPTLRIPDISTPFPVGTRYRATITINSLGYYKSSSFATLAAPP